MKHFLFIALIFCACAPEVETSNKKISPEEKIRLDLEKGMRKTEADIERLFGLDTVKE